MNAAAVTTPRMLRHERDQNCDTLHPPVWVRRLRHGGIVRDGFRSINDSEGRPGRGKGRTAVRRSVSAASGQPCDREHSRRPSGSRADRERVEIGSLLARRRTEGRTPSTGGEARFGYAPRRIPKTPRRHVTPAAAGASESGALCGGRRQAAGGSRARVEIGLTHRALETSAWKKTAATNRAGSPPRKGSPGELWPRTLQAIYLSLSIIFSIQSFLFQGIHWLLSMIGVDDS